jgi:ferrochelatase
MNYHGEADFAHGEVPAVGVLLTNLGTPDAPTTPALRRYLREFLSDPRVIELPVWKWQPILNLFVLTTRPAKSAEAYRTVWTDEGSPLLVITRRQAAGVEERLRRLVASPLHVAIGMRYGNPSVASGLRELKAKGCRRILLLPLYPQYAAATTASTVDAVTEELRSWRWVPELRTVHQYHDDPAYIAALAASLREGWGEDGPAEKLIFSFHGIPERYFLGGDPYHCQCHKTARLVAEALELPKDRYEVCFQSLFGKEEWIKPYTADTVTAMAKSGINSLDVICPGFSADCLETLEEIDGENRHYFEDNGGDRFRYIPALNDRPDHLDALAGVVHRNLAGWVAGPSEWNSVRAEEEAEASRTRAEAMARCPVRADGGYGE